MAITTGVGAETAGPDPEVLGLPPLPEISWPKSDDKRRAAISLGSQMAEAEALWQMQALGEQARQRLQAQQPDQPPSKTPET